MQIIRQAARVGQIPPRLLAALPTRLAQALNRSDLPAIEELRLHSGRLSTVTSFGKNLSTGVVLSEDELADVLKKVCSNSLYAYGESICQGFVTMEGGIRVGVGGSAAIEDGRVIGVHRVTSLCIRIPHHVHVDPTPVLSCLLGERTLHSLLLYAPPGVGKTTLLRAVTQKIASPAYGVRTVVVDTREELCFGLEDERLALTVLRGYPRRIGIEIAVRCMGASLIVCDEIGNDEDAEALLAAGTCGVAILATAHAQSLDGLLRRPAFHSLDKASVFHSYIGLFRERTQLCYEVQKRHAAAGSGGVR